MKVITDKETRELIYANFNPGFGTPDNLNMIMYRHKLDNSKMARILGISRALVAKLKKSEFIPVKIAWALRALDYDFSYKDVEGYRTGQDLARLRKALGLTIDQMAIFLGLYYSSYYAYENDKNEIPKYIRIACKYIERNYEKYVNAFLEVYSRFMNRKRVSFK